jgi:hypothetical protein
MNLREVTNKNGNLIPDPHNVFNRWKSFFNHLLNVHGFHKVRQTEIQTAQLFVPETSLVELEIAIGMLKRYKSPGNDQISGELIKAAGETLYSEIRRLICSLWNNSTAVEGIY